KKGPFGWDVRASAGHGEPNPTWIPEGYEATRMIAEEIGGIPGGTWADLFDVPMTAHFLGGCAIGDSPETGVIDAYHRVYGHPGLHVVDGSAVSANLGVNPSLTITAQAERARWIAGGTGGSPGGTWADRFDVPMTAHFLGGCAIGDSPETGVIDAYHRVYGHPGLHVVDGSAVSANLGVNPSLTITAQAERAMSFWPNRSEKDPRPPLAEAYRRVAPVPPQNPLVPPDAPAALRLPIVEIT